MNDPDVDALVRAHLAREAAKVDAAAVLAGVKARLAEQAPRAVAGRIRPRRRAWWGGVAAAAAVAAVLFGGRFLPPPVAVAGPEVLVRAAREVHALPVDRCYRVQVVPALDGPLARHPLMVQARETRLWTRDDRFWIETINPERKWAWGRDEHGAVWLAAGRKQGVRYDGNEVPEPVSLACDVCSLRVETLLDDVLAGFDLRREPGAVPGTQRIRAEPRPGRPNPGLRAVVLDVDEQSRVLRRLELQRTRGGRLLATATFTLAETRPQDPASYQLEGHLDPGAPVADRQHRPLLRPIILVRFLGAPLLRGKP
jgi:hypothetical protein